MGYGVLDVRLRNVLRPVLDYGSCSFWSSIVRGCQQNRRQRYLQVHATTIIRRTTFTCAHEPAHVEVFIAGSVSAGRSQLPTVLLRARTSVSGLALDCSGPPV